MATTTCPSEANRACTGMRWPHSKSAMCAVTVAEGDEGCLRVEGTRLVAASGEVVQLRGVNFGGWLVSVATSIAYISPGVSDTAFL